MFRRCLLALPGMVLGLAFWTGSAAPAQAQQYEMNRFFYYPYYYYSWNYWPVQGPKYPEPVGAAYMPPPAYMAFPPYKPPNWHFDYWHKMPYYRGSHFLLDVF